MKKLKIGVIGTGRIGKVHIATLVQNVPQADVVAIADTNLASANAVAKEFGITSVYGNYMDVLNHPEVEAVAICSPTDTHAKYIVDAAKAGKHIFCENRWISHLISLKGPLKQLRKPE